MIRLKPVIDFHSHILPGIDDGSPDVQTSIAMLRMQAEQGITHAVATPHFYPQRDKPERFLERRARSEEKLRREMAKYSDLPQLIVGAEVYYFRSISHSEVLPLLTIGEKKCIMIEMPHIAWEESVFRELQQVHGHFGLVPVLAHIDRYISPLRNRRLTDRLAQLPVAIQANAEFFIRKATCGMAVRMAKAGQIHLLGSDCHNLKDRKPNLDEAVRILRSRDGEEAWQHICTNGQELLGLSDC